MSTDRSAPPTEPPIAEHRSTIEPLRWSSLLPAIRRALARFVLVGMTPIAAFYVVFRLVGPMEGIAAGTITATAALLIQGYRLGRFDPVGIVPIGAVIVQGGAGLAFQSVDVYLAAPAVENALWGLALIGSVLIGHPFISLAARELELLPQGVRGRPAVTRALCLVTVAWAVASFAKSGIRLALLAALPLELFLITNTVVVTALNVGLLVFTLWYPVRAANRPVGSKPSPMEQSAG
jgi:intracellular septation protein A